MKVSFNWLRELVDLKISDDELVNLLPLRTIGTKEVTDNFVELDMKGYNRADLLSLRGVALEVAAITDSKIKFEDPQEFLWEKHALPNLNIEVTEGDLCPVYCLARIEGLKVEKSDPKFSQRLSECGMRPVNNIADITNLVMLEYGQPLHAFDAESVSNQKVVVRTARPEEELTTLDGKTRKLSPANLVIADPEKALGIAGVMGGENSEVTDSTTTILLEAAIFEPTNLRATAQGLNLHSEASKRFQHGLTVKRLLQAFNAAIKMYLDLGGQLSAVTLHGDLDQEEPMVIPVNLKKVNSLIGVGLSGGQVINYLESLGCKSELVGDEMNIVPPYYRLDLNIQEDIIEEIARLYGYENIPAKKLEGKSSSRADQSRFKFLNELKEKLVHIGLTEVQTYSYVSTQIIQNMGWEDNLGGFIKILNPMSKETSYLRQSLWANLVEVVSKNQKYNLEDIAIFEVGKVYNIGKDQQPDESWQLSVALMNNTENPVAELNKIAGSVLKGIEVEPDHAPEIVKDLFHPKRFLSVIMDGKVVGGLSEVHRRSLDKFGIEKRLAVFEVNLSDLI